MRKTIIDTRFFSLWKFDYEYRWAFRLFSAKFGGPTLILDLGWYTIKAGF